jgi:hypothetical protein
MAAAVERVRLTRRGRAHPLRGNEIRALRAAVRKKERASIAATGCRAGPGANRILELRADSLNRDKAHRPDCGAPGDESYPGVVYGSTSTAAYGGRRSTESTPGPCWQKGRWWGVMTNGDRGDFLGTPHLRFRLHSAKILQNFSVVYYRLPTMGFCDGLGGGAPAMGGVLQAATAGSRSIASLPPEGWAARPCRTWAAR